MDMRGRRSRAVEFTLEVVQRDVVADHVLCRINAEVESSGGACEAAGGFGAVDDFFGDGVDGLHRGEVEDLVGVECVGCDAGLGVHVEADLDGDDTIRSPGDGSGGGAER